MNDYISKPLDFNKFYEVLSKWVKVSNPIEQHSDLKQIQMIVK